MNIKGFEIRGDYLIIHTNHSDALEFAAQNDPFNGGDYEIKRTRKRRSLDANAYMWALCTDVGNALGISKEEVYRHNIREGGEYTPLPIKDEAVEDFSKKWSSKGIGWFCDVVGSSKLPGFTLIFAYYGSSEYDSKQMSMLISRIKEDAMALGIVTESQEQIDKMIDDWEKYKS